MLHHIVVNSSEEGKMSDMFDSGYYAFKSWAKQSPMPNGKIYENEWLGKFNPKMTGKEANERLDHVNKITIAGQQSFIRGWHKAKQDYKCKNCLWKHPEKTAICF